MAVLSEPPVYTDDPHSGQRLCSDVSGQGEADGGRGAGATGGGATGGERRTPNAEPRKLPGSVTFR